MAFVDRVDDFFAAIPAVSATEDTWVAGDQRVLVGNDATVLVTLHPGKLRNQGLQPFLAGRHHQQIAGDRRQRFVGGAAFVGTPQHDGFEGALVAGTLVATTLVAGTLAALDLGNDRILDKSHAQLLGAFPFVLIAGHLLGTAAIDQMYFGDSEGCRLLGDVECCITAANDDDGLHPLHRRAG